MGRKYGVPIHIRRQEHQKYLASNASTVVKVPKEEHEALNNELVRRGMMPIL